MSVVKKETKSIEELLSAVDHSFQEVEILGEVTRLRPVTILECLRLVKRFPELMDLFEPKLDKEGNELPEALQPTIITLFMDSGAEAAVAFIACATNNEGNSKIEEGLLTKPDDFILSMFSKSVKVTLGEGSLEDFFMKIGKAMEDIFPKK